MATPLLHVHVAVNLQDRSAFIAVTTTNLYVDWWADVSTTIVLTCVDTVLLPCSPVSSDIVPGMPPAVVMAFAVYHLYRRVTAVCVFLHILLSCAPVVLCAHLMAGKFVPESAVLEMKANFVLPEKSENLFDRIDFIELPQEQVAPLVQW